MLINDWAIAGTHIDGCKVVTMKRSSDERGIFVEGYVYGKVPGFECRQSNVVRNLLPRRHYKWVEHEAPMGKHWYREWFPKTLPSILRGVHASPYQKLVTCPEGQIYDVCVDLRPGSPTYGEHFGTWVYASKALLIPAYCGHAYLSPGESTVLYQLRSRKPLRRSRWVVG